MALNAQKVATLDKNLRMEMQAIKQIQQGMAFQQLVIGCSANLCACI